MAAARSFADQTLLGQMSTSGELSALGRPTPGPLAYVPQALEIYRGLPIYRVDDFHGRHVPRATGVSFRLSAAHTAARLDSGR